MSEFFFPSNGEQVVPLHPTENEVSTVITNRSAPKPPTKSKDLEPENYYASLKILLRLFVQHRRASPRLIQDNYDVGYETALTVLDQMAQLGWIGIGTGSLTRPLMNKAFEMIRLWNGEDEAVRQRELEREVNERDDLFEQALRICVEMKRASTSILQRRLSIGYGRAAKIVDEMERDGYIGQADSFSKPRPVLGKAHEQVTEWDKMPLS